MAKLWQKFYSFNSLIEEFTVGLDFELDKELVVADCLGSIAQARMLKTIGIITEQESNGLEAELRAITREGEEGGFEILREDEDCHTAIENRLTEKLGESGKKIHTGRSRNDQVLTALRIYEREFLLELARTAVAAVRALADLADRNSGVPMPGRTHSQIAMPSSVGLWAAAYAEEIMGHLGLLPSIFALVD
ncbi:MAG: argininosuccinate lyase, partial [Spirochaetales bacterium]|nr:argininosuccinate lyase [Spirochaetales bacterium]